MCIICIMSYSEMPIFLLCVSKAVHLGLADLLYACHTLHLVTNNVAQKAQRLKETPQIESVTSTGRVFVYILSLLKAGSGGQHFVPVYPHCGLQLQLYCSLPFFCTTSQLQYSISTVQRLSTSRYALHDPALVRVRVKSTSDRHVWILVKLKSNKGRCA